MKKIICDCCGRDIEIDCDGESVFSLRMCDDSDKTTDMDLCEICYKSIRHGIKIFISKK